MEGRPNKEDLSSAQCPRTSGIAFVNPKQRDDNWGMISKLDEKFVIPGYTRIPLLVRHYTAKPSLGVNGAFPKRGLRNVSICPCT